MSPAPPPAPARRRSAPPRPARPARARGGPTPGAAPPRRAVLAAPRERSLAASSESRLENRAREVQQAARRAAASASRALRRARRRRLLGCARRLVRRPVALARARAFSPGAFRAPSPRLARRASDASPSSARKRSCSATGVRGEVGGEPASRSSHRRRRRALERGDGGVMPEAKGARGARPRRLWRARSARLPSAGPSSRGAPAPKPKGSRAGTGCAPPNAPTRP